MATAPKNMPGRTGWPGPAQLLQPPISRKPKSREIHSRKLAANISFPLNAAALRLTGQRWRPCNHEIERIPMPQPPSFPKKTRNEAIPEPGLQEADRLPSLPPFVCPSRQKRQTKPLTQTNQTLRLRASNPLPSLWPSANSCRLPPPSVRLPSQQKRRTKPLWSPNSKKPNFLPSRLEPVPIPPPSIHALIISLHSSVVPKKNIERSHYCPRTQTN
jgi:hypothetical protein